MLEECGKERDLQAMLVDLCLDYVENETKLAITDRTSCEKVLLHKWLFSSLVPRSSSTFTFGGSGMPNQNLMFEWMGPRQCFCTQCHYDNFM